MHADRGRVYMSAKRIWSMLDQKMMGVCFGSSLHAAALVCMHVCVWYMYEGACLRD